MYPRRKIKVPFSFVFEKVEALILTSYTNSDKRNKREGEVATLLSLSSDACRKRDAYFLCYKRANKENEKKEGGEGGTFFLRSPVPSLLIRSLSLAMTACPLECKLERKCLSARKTQLRNPLPFFTKRQS